MDCCARAQGSNTSNTLLMQASLRGEGVGGDGSGRDKREAKKIYIIHVSSLKKIIIKVHALFIPNYLLEITLYLFYVSSILYCTFS